MRRIDWFAVGITALGVAAGFIFGGRTAGFIFLGVAIVSLVIWFRQKEQVIPQVDAKAWQELADKFGGVDVNVYADWFAEDRAFFGLGPVGELWTIRGAFEGTAEHCESLCHLAGAMLLKSPRVSTELSAKVKTRSRDSWRWLYFLSENHSALKFELYGKTLGERLARSPETGRIKSLANASKNACIQCAAKEV